MMSISYRGGNAGSRNPRVTKLRTGVKRILHSQTRRMSGYSMALISPSTSQVRKHVSKEINEFEPAGCLDEQQHAPKIAVFSSVAALPV